MIDLAAEVVAALRSASGREALREAIAPVIADVVRAELAARAEQLQPLDAILGCSRKAATARIRADKSLRTLGVPSGKRLLFRRSDVEAYLRARRPR